MVAEKPDERIEFIDGAIGFDAEMAFWHFCAADEGGRAFVACFCIDPECHGDRFAAFASSRAPGLCRGYAGAMW
jgi:hypothetical protein